MEARDVEKGVDVDTSNRGVEDTIQPSKDKEDLEEPHKE